MAAYAQLDRISASDGNDSSSMECTFPSSDALCSAEKPTPSTVTLKLNFSEQHTVSWSSPLTTLHGTNCLPPGECNLYQFPLVNFPGEQRSAADLPEWGVDILRAAVLQLCTAPHVLKSGSDPASIADNAGAYLLHGLLIANTAAALALALDILKHRPALLTQAHAAGPFVGENHLHVLAVNQRQDEVCSLLSLAVEHLDDDSLRSLLLSMASGGFFTVEPMRSYGGSPVAYLASFRATKALTAMLDQPRLAKLVDLNGTACPFSGYYPIHAAVANCRTDAYDLLATYGADPEVCTVATAMGGLQLSAIQLACRLGHQTVLEHILHRRWQVMLSPNSNPKPS